MVHMYLCMYVCVYAYVYIPYIRKFKIYSYLFDTAIITGVRKPIKFQKDV
jgi:hypothetical protein